MHINVSRVEKCLEWSNFSDKTHRNINTQNAEVKTQFPTEVVKSFSVLSQLLFWVNIYKKEVSKGVM